MFVPQLFVIRFIKFSKSSRVMRCQETCVPGIARPTVRPTSISFASRLRWQEYIGGGNCSKLVFDAPWPRGPPRPGDPNAQSELISLARREREM